MAHQNVINFQLFKLLTLLTFNFLLLTFNSFAQHTITGNFPLLAGQQVRMVGFEGFGIYTIDSSRVSGKGVFKLTYTDKDRGGICCYVIRKRKSVVCAIRHRAS